MLSLAQISVTLFLIMDPLGNIPAFIALLKDFSPRKQRIIVLREMLIALGVIILFNFLGEQILDALHISHPTVQLAGGLILFIIALQMIFPRSHHVPNPHPHEDPLIVPLAIPLVAGPSILGTVMIYAHQENDPLKMTSAIFIAWIASTIILLASSFLKQLLGSRVLIAGERLMGFIMTIIAVESISQGVLSLTCK